MRKSRKKNRGSQILSYLKGLIIQSPRRKKALKEKKESQIIAFLTTEEKIISMYTLLGLSRKYENVEKYRLIVTDQRFIRIRVYKYFKPTLNFALPLSDIVSTELSIKRYIPWMIFGSGLFVFWVYFGIHNGFTLEPGFLYMPLLGVWSIRNFIYHKTKKLYVHTRTGAKKLHLDTISDSDAYKLESEIRERSYKKM